MDPPIKHSSGDAPQIIKLHVKGQDIELVKIPAGSFFLGSKPDEKGHRDVEGPVRKIKISKPFYLGRFEITQAQYEAVIGANPSSVKGTDLPVDQITYTKAIDFCSKLSSMVGRKVTLPTEAQWEYACRAGIRTRFYTGDSGADLEKAAWFRDNSNGSVHPVGKKAPNAFGLYDMHGNISELCLDVLPDYSTISEVDPVGELSDDQGSMRGGGWMHDAEYCRSACGMRTNDMFGGTGIRIVVNAD